MEDLVREKVVQELEKRYDYEALRAQKEPISETLQERFSYEYPYKHELAVAGKVSVSELKKAAMEEDVRELFEEPEIVPYIPAFLREERKNTGAERGTAYHRVLECIELSDVKHSDQIKERIDKMVAEGKLGETAAESVNPYDIYLFCQSSLCKRMLKAKEAGRLFKEQPFVIAKPAVEVYPEQESTQEVLVQGIMDAYFEEDGEYVLLDYKTDHIKTAKDLTARYEKQLQVYAEALEQMTGKKVKERVMYSFCLGEEIFV